MDCIANLDHSRDRICMSSIEPLAKNPKTLWETKPKEWEKLGFESVLYS